MIDRGLPSGRGQRRDAVSAGANSGIHAYPISSFAEGAPRSFSSLAMKAFALFAIVVVPFADRRGWT
jgi:hypothetical protein